MRPRTLALLSILVLGLLAFIWFFERELPSTDERAELEKKVIHLQEQEISAVRIERGEKSVVLRRVAAPEEGAPGRGAGWVLEDPMRAPGDDAAIDRLVRTLVGLEKERTLVDLEAQAVGLSRPRATVILEAEAGEVRLLVGDAVPASTEMVVALGDAPDRYFVVPDTLWRDLEKEPGDWRSREPFPGRRDQIMRVALSRGEVKVLLARRGERFWIESPISDRADEGLVSGLLANLTELRIDEFLDQPSLAAVEMGLDPALGRVEAILEGEEQPFLVLLGEFAEQGGRFARIGEQYVVTGSDIFSEVERSAEDWRDLVWSSLDSYQIDRISVRRGGESFEMVRRGADWLRDGEEIDYGPVSDFLYALTGLEAQEILTAEEVEAGGIGDAALDLEIVLTGKDGEQERLLLHKPDARGRLPARADSRDVALILSQEGVEDLLQKLEAVRKAESITPEEEPGEQLAVGD